MISNKGNWRKFAAFECVQSSTRCVTVFLATGGILLPAAVAPCVFLASSELALAQATPANRQLGTVKTVSANKLTIASDAGAISTINVVDDAKVLQLSPGNTDLKTAKTIALGDIEVGDRVLVTGHQDATDAFTASRVILMKSTDIAHKNEAEEQDWQKRGTGGLVSAVDPASGSVTIAVRGRKVQVKSTSATVFRRYAGDSVKFQDAAVGTIAQIQPGDQLRVRGAKSADGSTIEAEEVVSGSFRNLAGTIVSIDVPGNKVTLKDLTTKKTYSIQLTANSSLRVLPAEVAARFAARARSGSNGSSTTTANGAGSASAGAGNSSSASHAEGGGGAGMDLSQMLARLPEGNLKDLHTGDALMVVASQPQQGSISLTAITLLSGVEPILAATPTGTPSMTLSPWSVGGAPDTGGA